jgi:hypothetical protein
MENELIPSVPLAASVLALSEKRVEGLQVLARFVDGYFNGEVLCF